MNPGTRRAALFTIGGVALVVGADALVHSYAGLYGWAVHHRLSGWQAWTWPAEIDVFLVVGELALYVAYLDAWPFRQRAWPWATAVVGLAVSVAGNVGHIQPIPNAPVSLADRITAAASPVAAFAALMIGLLVLKMHHSAERAVGKSPGRVPAENVEELPVADQNGLLDAAASILEQARTEGRAVSQRALAAQLREQGHRFSNAQLRRLAASYDSHQEAQAA